MKKSFLGFAAIIGLSVALFSCSDDDKDEKGPGEYPFSTDTPEEIKKHLATQGETIIKSIEGLTDDSAIKALISFGYISDQLESSVSVDDITSLAELSGKHTWSAKDGMWITDKTFNEKKTVFVFPKEIGLSTNEAKIEVTSTNSNVEAENGFIIPNNVTLNIYVSDKKVGDMVVSASNLNASTIADAASAVFNLGNYKLAGNISKKGSENKATFDFTASGKSLMTAEADLAMTITAEMLEKEDYSSLKDGNFSASIAGDIAMTGYINLAKYRTELAAIEAELDALWKKYLGEDGIVYEDVDNDGYYDYNEELAQEYRNLKRDIQIKEAKALNDNSNIILVSKSQEKKLADVIFKEDIEVDSWTNWDDIEVTYYYVDSKPVFVFGDKTEVDADVYFSKGFDKVINAINDILAKYITEDDVDKN